VCPSELVGSDDVSKDAVEQYIHEQKDKQDGKWTA
jgi:hypothetical protein